MSIYPVVFNINRPDLAFSIAPTEDVAVNADTTGDINLYSQASMYFGKLRESNVFRGETNQFRTVFVQRLQTLSDERAKSHATPIDPAAASRLVQSLPYLSRCK